MERFVTCLRPPWGDRHMMTTPPPPMHSAQTHVIAQHHLSTMAVLRMVRAQSQLLMRQGGWV